MCYNFDFLKKEEKYKDFTYACIEAEKSLVVSYASAAILAEEHWNWQLSGCLAMTKSWKHHIRIIWRR